MPLELPESWKPGGDGYLSRDVAMEDADIARDVAPSREETGKNNSKPPLLLPAMLLRVPLFV